MSSRSRQTSAAAVSVDRGQQRRRANHERIHGAARNLFLERGFDATTVDDIAEQAEVSQKTFFNHYASKDALLQELASGLVSELERLLSLQCRREASTRQRLEGFFLVAAQGAETTRLLSRDLLHRILRGSSSQPEPSDELRRVRAAFRTVLEVGIEQGDVSDHFEMEFLADMVSGAFIAVMLHWLNEPAYPLPVRLRETAAFLEIAFRPASPAGLGGQSAPFQEARAEAARKEMKG